MTPRVRLLAALVAGPAVVLAVLLISRIEPTPQPGSPRTAVPRSTASGTPAAAPSTSPSTASVSPAPSPAASPGNLSQARIGLREVVGGLAAPVFVGSAADGSRRLFVLEQAGTIRIVKDGQLVKAPFLDIHARVGSGGERGLLGLAFPPGYATAGGAGFGTFYVDYTDVNGDTNISEFRVSGQDGDLADPGSGRVLLHIKQPFANHNGGGLAFGRDGFLYIGMGDGGSGGDPMGNGQRLDTLLGKILRIDVTGARGSAPYLVPDDNPFTGGGSDRPEIWAYGMRNPWRFSFDRANGNLWIGDVGQNRYEEVDRATDQDGFGRGANFGWNIMEGAHCYPSGNSCDTARYVPPLTEYDHSAGDCAIIGGFVYRGAAIPNLVGGYLFGDECSGTLRVVGAGASTGVKPRIILESGKTIGSLGEDEAGELYVADIGGGTIWQVVEG